LIEQQTMERWIEHVDSLLGGQGGSEVWDRIANGVFFAGLLQLVKSTKENSLEKQHIPPLLQDQDLILHAKNKLSRKYNWTKVVFPQLQEITNISPSLKQKLVDADPEALLKLLSLLRKRKLVPVPKQKNKHHHNPHHHNPHHQQPLKDFSQTKTPVAQNTKEMDHGYSPTTSPTIKMIKRKLGNDDSKLHEPYVSDKAVDELNRRVQKLLEVSREERERDFNISIKTTLDGNGDSTDSSSIHSGRKKNPAQNHSRSPAMMSTKKKRTRVKHRNSLALSSSSLPVLTVAPKITKQEPPISSSSNVPELVLPNSRKIPSKQQLTALINDCTMEAKDPKRVIAATSIGFKLLEKLVRLSPQTSTRQRNTVTNSIGSMQRCSAHDATRLFKALMSALINCKNNLVRSHVALNMITMLRNLSDVIPEDLRFLPINAFAQEMASLLTATGGNSNIWSTLSEDLRIVSVLSENYLLNVQATLSLCDPLSEIWLTETAWSQPACEVLTRLIMHHVAESNDICEFVLRLVNVALGVYHKLEVDKVVASNNHIESQGLHSLSTEKTPLQRQIIDFLSTLIVPNESVRTIDLVQEIGELVVETLRSLRAIHKKYDKLRQQNIRSTVGLEQEILAAPLEQKSQAVHWLEQIANELSVPDKDNDSVGELEVEGVRNMNQEMTLHGSSKNNKPILSPMMLDRLSQTKTPIRGTFTVTPTPFASDNLLTPNSSRGTPYLSVMAMPVSPTEIVANPANNNQPTILVDPSVKNRGTVVSITQSIVPIVSPTATIIDTVPRSLTPQCVRSPFASPQERSKTLALLDEKLSEMKRSEKKNGKNEAHYDEAEDEDEDAENDAIQDALDIAREIQAIKPATSNTVIHHHVHHMDNISPTVMQKELQHSPHSPHSPKQSYQEPTSPPSPPSPPTPTLKFVTPRKNSPPDTADHHSRLNIPPTERIRSYLKATCYPSEQSVLNKFGLEHFCKQIIGDVQLQCLSKKDCQRFCAFMDKSGQGNISLDAMVHFIQQGIALDDRKRLAYMKKSEMHVKLMSLVLEIWKKAVKAI
jgi:hypothetical protein